MGRAGGDESSADLVINCLDARILGDTQRGLPPSIPRASRFPPKARLSTTLTPKPKNSIRVDGLGLKNFPNSNLQGVVAKFVHSFKSLRGFGISLAWGRGVRGACVVRNGISPSRYSW